MCSEQLELVEDKLRDFRTLSDDDGDDKVRQGHPEPACACAGSRLLVSCTATQSKIDLPDSSAPFQPTLCRWLQTVALSQLDSLRRELISCAKDRLPLVVFAKVCTAPPGTLV